MPTGDDEPDPPDPDALPVTLPKGPVAHPRFSHAAIDYSINKRLQDLLPAQAGTVVLDVKLHADGDSKVLTGVVAHRFNDRWGLVLAGSMDLVNRRNYEVEIMAVRKVL